ncbi:MAG: hypothetical protein ACYC05_05750 [Sulfuricella sp.]|nr:hypothetical protein [Gammaproteobacteria bacterium]
MNSPQEKDFFNFENLLRLWAGAYQRAVVSYVGLKTPQGPRLLFGRVFLEPTRAGVSDTAFKFETDHLVAARFATNATLADVDSFLTFARNGEMQCIDGSTTIALQSDGDPSTYLAPIYHPFVTEGPRLPSLLVRGTSRHNLLVNVADSRHLDWELKSAETPFDNLDELLGQCGLPALNQMGDSTTLEIVARAPTMISGASTIKGRRVVIECHLAAGLDVEKLRLGYKILHKDSVDRGSVSGSKLKWRQKGDINVGTWRMPVGDASLLQAFLSYAGVAHHQWWVADPQKRLNPRHAIHQVFDDDMESLRKMLFKPETDKSQMFESAVSTLLSLLGFSVTNYGRAPKLQEGPDIIVVAPSGHVVVVECTIGLLDRNDKLAKLVQRSKLIRDKLDHAGYGFLQLQSMIVSPLSREEVTANLETAGKHDIAVVCKEDIEGMLNQVSLPLNADKLFQDAKRLIPNQMGQLRFPERGRDQ